MWTGLIGSEQGPSIGCCEHGYELSDTTESKRFVGWPRNYRPFKE
jgi:hypothetical protein